VYQVGAGVSAVAVGDAVVPLWELSVRFSVPYRRVEKVARSSGVFAEAAPAAAKLAANGGLGSCGGSARRRKGC
jgi:hypothetical protein